MWLRGSWLYISATPRRGSRSSCPHMTWGTPTACHVGWLRLRNWQIVYYFLSYYDYDLWLYNPLGEGAMVAKYAIVGREFSPVTKSAGQHFHSPLLLIHNKNGPYTLPWQQCCNTDRYCTSCSLTTHIQGLTNFTLHLQSLETAIKHALRLLFHTPVVNCGVNPVINCGVNPVINCGVNPVINCGVRPAQYQNILHCTVTFRWTACVVFTKYTNMKLTFVEYLACQPRSSYQIHNTLQRA